MTRKDNLIHISALPDSSSNTQYAGSHDLKLTCGGVDINGVCSVNIGKIDRDVGVIEATITAYVVLGREE